MRSDQDANKDPSQLEREVEEQRREIGETMRALEDRFSSREIYNQASHYMKEHGREFAESFGNSIKANPLPVAVTAIGLLWMMVGQRPSTRAPRSYGAAYSGRSDYSGQSQGSGRAEKLKQAGSQLRERASSAGESAAQGAQQLRERAGEARRSISDRMSGMREGMSHSMSGMREGMSHSMSGMREGMSHSKERFGDALHSGRSNMEHWLHDQPMAVGALGIALGAIIGAAMPRTRAENRLLGSIGDQARSKASELAEKGYQKASEVGESIGQQAQQAMEPSEGESSSSSGKESDPAQTPPPSRQQSSPASRGPSASP